MNRRYDTGDSKQHGLSLEDTTWVDNRELRIPLTFTHEWELERFQNNLVKRLAQHGKHPSLEFSDAGQVLSGTAGNARSYLEISRAGQNGVYVLKGNPEQEDEWHAFHELGTDVSSIVRGVRDEAHQAVDTQRFRIRTSEAEYVRSRVELYCRRLSERVEYAVQLPDGFFFEQNDKARFKVEFEGDFVRFTEELHNLSYKEPGNLLYEVHQAVTRPLDAASTPTPNFRPADDPAYWEAQEKLRELGVRERSPY